MNPIGSKAFSFNGLDWQAIKRTAYRGIGGVVLTLVPQFISPNIHYSLTVVNHTIDYSLLVVIVGTSIVRAVEAFLKNNT
jgi:hypothetical protein